MCVRPNRRADAPRSLGANGVALLLAIARASGPLALPGAEQQGRQAEQDLVRERQEIGHDEIDREQRRGQHEELGKAQARGAACDQGAEPSRIHVGYDSVPRRGVGAQGPPNRPNRR